MGYEAFYVICPRASSQYATPLSNAWFLSHFCDKVTDSDWCAAQSLLDIMNIREGSSVLKFSDDSTFSASELSFITLHVATNRMD